MKFLNVNYSKGQIKIQQMAFVLVAVVIFFALVSLVFFSFYSNSIRSDAGEFREDNARETVRKISGTPEFSWSVGRDCAACIDFDKVFALKNRSAYQDFWRGINYIEVVKVFPADVGECTISNYPNCGSVKLVDKGGNFISHSVFVSLCRYDSSINYDRCELGKVIMGFEPT